MVRNRPSRGLRRRRNHRDSSPMDLAFPVSPASQRTSPQPLAPTLPAAPELDRSPPHAAPAPAPRSPPPAPASQPPKPTSRRPSSERRTATIAKPSSSAPASPEQRPRRAQPIPAA